MLTTKNKESSQFLRGQHGLQIRGLHKFRARAKNEKRLQSLQPFDFFRSPAGLEPATTD
jgi:hypothetical protein